MIFVNSTQSTTSENYEAPTEENTQLTEAEVTLNNFWPSVTDDVKRIKSVDAKNQVLPLARIKKIMKLDEDVKMISAEAPLLFSKAAEIFIHELTLRAWVHTENNKRRTLQRNDIAMAITKYDQFDFLIDIVPREPELPKKPKESPPPQKPNGEPIQYYLQLPQQQQTMAAQNMTGIPATSITGMPTTHTLTMPTNTINTMPHTIQIPTNQLPITTLNANGTQNILVTNTGQPLTSVGGAVLNNLGALQAQNTQPPLQLVQQIVTANGEIQHMPISIPQNFLRVQNQANSQPILISAASLTNQPQILQMTSSTTPSVFLNTSGTDE